MTIIVHDGLWPIIMLCDYAISFGDSVLLDD